MDHRVAVDNVFDETNGVSISTRVDGVVEYYFPAIRVHVISEPLRY